MKKTYIKSFFKNIYHSLSRLLSIICIVILGVGFLVGLLTSAPNVENSIDLYYDQYNISDLDVMTSIGVDQSTIDILKENIEEIDDIKLESRSDKNVIYGKDTIAAKIIDYDFDSTINQLELKEGKLPEKENEVAVNISNNFLIDIPLDSNLIIDNENYVVTAKVLDPNFFDRAKTTSSLGKGYLETIIYRNSDFYDEPYSDIFITVKGAKELSSFSNEYESLIDDVQEQINSLSEEIKDARYQSLFDEAFLDATNDGTVYEEAIAQAKEEALQTAIEEAKKQIQTMFPSLSDEQVNQMIESQMDTIESEVNKQIEENIPTIKAEVDSQIKIEIEASLDENLDSYFLITLNRDYYQAFRSIGENVNKINVISMIFPVFFFLVAALVVLTTMTRMVEEERLQIGTLKSLGYTRGAIMGNYIGYALFSSIVGGLLGIAAGVYFLPAIIYNIFNANYILPPFAMTFSYPAILLSFFAMVIIILLTTVLTVANTLKEKPAALMLKRAPKPGKKIFLERIKFIWNHLKFKNKSALRNVFRYKKHMIMTIVGVAGCTALLIAGFGIKDSFDGMVSKQYDELIKYQVALNVNDINVPVESIDDYQNIKVHTESANLESKDDSRYDFTLIVTDSFQDLSSYVEFDYQGLNNDSIIVSKQLSSDASIDEDGNFIITTQTNQEFRFTYDATFNNYIGNYIIMGEEAYRDIFNKDCTYNSIYVLIDNFTDALQETLSEAFTLDSNVTSFEFINQTQETYFNMFDNIGLIVYFLIICSGALAIIVIYNLTNINIIERNKEIATLKVLGYKRIEVANYVYKETFILTTLGILVGLLVGYILHQFIMYCVDSPGILMFKGINWYSYLIAIALSYLFLIIVDFLLFFKLEKIKMVESLKSVD